MDAKDRLRRYLEQRRELGESELVLDGLGVDDVMAILGARAIAKAPRTARAPVTAMAPPVTVMTPPVTIATPAKPSARSAPISPAAPTSVGVRDNTARHPAWLTDLGIPSGVASASAVSDESTPFANDVRNARTLDAVADLVRACNRCALHGGSRNPVPGEGNPQAEFVCVGEAPGENEDQQGRPFVGEAGQLLTKILSAIQLPRDAVFICNVLKHRPPANRDPLPEEVVACEPFLHRQLELLQPRVILALGRFAAQTLLGSSLPLNKLRGQVHAYRGVPVIATYHPAALLRNESWKRPTWDDVQLARRILDASRTSEPRGTPGA